MNKDDKDILNRVVYKRSVLTNIIHITLQLLTVATLIAVIVEYCRGDMEIASSTFVMQIVMCCLALAFFNILLIFEHVFKFFIPNYLLVLVSAFIFVNCILGNVFQLFNTQNGVFDKILHVATGVIVTLFALSVVNLFNDLSKTRWKISPMFVVIFCFCFAMMVAVIWEIFEYTLDYIQPSLNMQRWNDSLIQEIESTGTYIVSDPKGSAINDTMWDMTCNVIGSVITCIYCYFRIRRYSTDWIIKMSVLTPKQQKILIREQRKMMEAQQSLNLEEKPKKVKKVKGQK